MNRKEEVYMKLKAVSCALRFEERGAAAKLIQLVCNEEARRQGEEQIY